MSKLNKKILKLLILTCITLLSIFPIFFLALMSISSEWTWPYVLPKSISLKSWKYVLSENPQTFTGIFNSLKIALITVLINLILAIPAGNALGRYKFKGKKIIELLLILPIIIPSIIFGVGIHTEFIKLNLADSTSGVVICHILLTLPYVIRTSKLSFENLAFDLEDQAKMLGANKLERLIFVILPFILPGIVAGTTLTILISTSEYAITALIGGGNVVTLPTLMFPFINNGDSVGSVYSILFALVIVASVLSMDYFLKRHFDEKKGY